MGIFIVIPNTSQPSSLSRCAVTLLSTPPLISTAICFERSFLGDQGEKLAGHNLMSHFSSVIIVKFLESYTGTVCWRKVFSVSTIGTG
jgi:hypothetical protein